MSTTQLRPSIVPDVVLEPAAQALADALAAAGGPRSTRFPRKRPAPCSIELQAGDVVMPPAVVEPHAIPGGPDGEISITVVRPVDSNGSLPAVVYTHGGGWILGSFATHERLVRDLVAQSGAAFVFVNYTPSPEARYPVAIEQVYATAKWVASYGAELGLNGRRLAVAGESVGGNMTAAVTLLAKERGGPAIAFRLCSTRSPMPTSIRKPTCDSPKVPGSPARRCNGSGTPTLPIWQCRAEPTASPLQATARAIAWVAAGVGDH